jgi:hypothetical protein
LRILHFVDPLLCFKKTSDSLLAEYEDAINSDNQVYKKWSVTFLSMAVHGLSTIVFAVELSWALLLVIEEIKKTSSRHYDHS